MCDECEFKCDEDDIYSKTDRRLTRQTRVRHLKIVLPDSILFVCPHYIALPLRNMLTCLPSNSRGHSKGRDQSQFDCEQIRKLSHVAFRNVSASMLNVLV